MIFKELSEVHNDFVEDKEILDVGLSANECFDCRRRLGVGRGFCWNDE